MSAESEKFGQDVAIAVGKLTAQKITSSDKFKNPCFDCGQALSQLNDNHFALGIDSLKKIFYFNHLLTEILISSI